MIENNISCRILVKKKKKKFKLLKKTTPKAKLLKNL